MMGVERRCEKCSPNDGKCRDKACDEEMKKSLPDCKACSHKESHECQVKLKTERDRIEESKKRRQKRRQFVRQDRAEFPSEDEVDDEAGTDLRDESRKPFEIYESSSEDDEDE